MRLGIRVSAEGFKMAEGHDDPNNIEDVARFARRFVAPRLEVPIEQIPGEAWTRLLLELVDLDAEPGHDGIASGSIELALPHDGKWVGALVVNAP